MIKAVVDSNVFIAGALSSRGASRRVINAMNDGLIIPIVSTETVTELVETLNDPKFERFINTDDINKLINDIHRHAICVKPTKLSSSVSVDPDDDVFLAIALSARANVIISLDNHLLEIKSFHKIPILDPGKFIKMFL